MTLSNSSVAGTHNIRHYRGDTFIRNFTVTDNEDPPVAIDLTGYSARLQVRESATKEAVLDISTTDHISITGVDNNVISINVPDSKTSFPAKTYLYDLELISAGGIRTTYLKGNFELTQDITQ
jgi:hypothetical protein